MGIEKIILGEVNDFDWVKEIDYLSYGYLKGKALEFNPPIDNKITVDKLLGILRELGFEFRFNGEHLNFAVTADSVLGLFMGDKNHSDGDMDSVVWTGNIPDETYQEHINEYADRYVEVLDGWKILPHDLV